MIPHVQLEDQACPACGKVINCHSCLNKPGASPRPGDLTLCFGCFTPLHYGPSLELVLLPADAPEYGYMEQLRHAAKARYG